MRRLFYDHELRYVVSVSDGVSVLDGMAIMGSTLVQQLEAGDVVLHSLILLTDFRMEEINDKIYSPYLAGAGAGSGSCTLEDSSLLPPEG